MEFNFVIVGAGAAGCVLAHRLSELPKAPSVCLIERGPSHNDSRWSIKMPGGCGYNLIYENQRDLWLRYLSEPENKLNGRRIDSPRGTGWGGSSAINGMQFVRGQSQDFDRWAKQDFCTELWSYEKCLPYFKKMENYTPGFEQSDAIAADAEDQCMKSLSNYRGLDGPIKVTSGRVTNREYSKCPMSSAFIRAAVQAGHKYNPDYNGATQEGVGWMDANASNGIRQSASRCYLLPALSQNNLNVVSNATVSRIILNGKRAVGVEYINASGEKLIVKATQEVLLCAGAYNSPQILMLSGIGDPVILQPLGIDVVHELPGVGCNLQDHIFVCLINGVRRPELSFRPNNWRNEWSDRIRAQWESQKEGWGSSNLFETCNFFKSNKQQTTANMQCGVAPMSVTVETDGAFLFNPGITAGINQHRPTSTGRLTLRSKNPSDDPIIESNYLNDTSEIRVYIDSIKLMRKVLSQPALSEYISEEMIPGPQVTSDEALEKYIRAASSTSFHPCGTCRMGDPDAVPTPEAARQLVVDTELRVSGLSGLRVVDASVMPSITSGNIHAPVLMIAERAADFIAASLK